MSSVIFNFLCRRHWLSSLLLGIPPLLIGLAVGFLYPTYSKQRALLKVMKYSTRFFGGGQLDMFSADGAFSLPFQHPMVFISFAILPAIPAFGIPAGDRGTKALDLILATPLSRTQLIRTVGIFQICGALYLAMITNISASASGLIAGEFADINHFGFFALAVLSFLLINTFAGMASVISVYARDRGQATLIYGILVALFFLTDVFARMWQKGDWLGFLTPYGYLRPARVLSQDHAFTGDALRDMVVLGSIALVGQLAATVLHKRRKSA